VISLIGQVGVRQQAVEVPKLLRDMAARGDSFYGKRTAKAA
jgi:hypothetical protein